MIQPGSSLGHYEIVSALGKGGMGEVWRARDTRLGREVAIKTLPPEFAEDADRLTRFEREARLLASLNHPNIAAIYGVEEHQGSRCLVLELVEGQTLGDRIRQGPIPVDEALGLAMQIADALKAAHETGVIHRDLKPDNVKVSEAGTVKVLDFGLAKAVEGSAQPDAANSPTLSMAATQAGVILGTAGYMSPEQAKGRRADRRTDIWALGCVLFEMLTGKPTFAGDDVTEILADVVRGEPNWELLPSDLPSNIAACLKLCLARAPGERVQDVGDLRLALGGAFAGSAASASPPQTDRTRFLWAAVAVFALAIGVGLGWTLPPRPANTPARVFEVASGDGIRFPRVSADGLQVAFVENDRLVVQSLQDGVRRELETPEGIAYPTWSPDGESIAYTQNGSYLRVIGANGEGDRQVADNIMAPFELAWCEEGIVFSRWAEGLFLWTGSQERLLIPIESDEDNLASARCLPDGRILAVSRLGDQSGGDQSSSIVLIDGDQRDVLWTQADTPIWSLAFVPPSTMLFARGDILFTTPSIWMLELSDDLTSPIGEPRLVRNATGQLSVSDDGLLVALSGLENSESRRMRWVGRNGTTLGEFGRPEAVFLMPSLSPDDDRIVASVRIESPAMISIHDESRAQVFREFPDTLYAGGRWSPVDDRIAYFSRPEAGRAASIAVASASTRAGSTIEFPLVEGTVILPGSLSWTPDAQTLVFATGAGPRDRVGLWTLALTPGSEPELLVDGMLLSPEISPDGNLIAYAELQSDRYEIVVARYPELVPVWPVTGGMGGRHPRWNDEGNELFYVSGPAVGSDPNAFRDLYAVTVDPDAANPVGEPEFLFNSIALDLSLTFRGGDSYDVASDGQRFLVSSSGVEGTPVITAITNVTEWLRDR